jgi:hypothetical protein
MGKKCEICVYFNNYKEEGIVNYLNIIINKGVPYEDIEKECYIKPVPTEEAFNKHKQKCLKDFMDEDLDLNIDDNILDTTPNNETSLFAFKNYDDISGENRVINLKKEWLSISEKLTQIVSYNVGKYNPDKVTTSENIKETVANLKTISDLIKSDFTFEFLKKETNIFDVLNDKEVETVKGIVDNAKTRQEELEKSK